MPRLTVLMLLATQQKGNLDSKKLLPYASNVLSLGNNSRKEALLNKAKSGSSSSKILFG